MGNYYSDDRIAEDHLHTDITCNIDEPQQKYRLRTVITCIRLLGSLNMFYWIQTLAISFCSGSKHLDRMKVSLPINEST